MEGSARSPYLAHIGGLISGALLGYLGLKFLGSVDEEVFSEDPREKIPSLLEKALQKIGELDMNGARPMLEQVLAIDPNNRNALTNLFNIDRLNPEGGHFHQTASRLLLHLSNDKAVQDLLLHTYKEYCKISKRPKLSPNLLFHISSFFSSHKYLEESEKILSLLLLVNPAFQKLPTGLIKLAQSYLSMGMAEKGKKCLRVICKKYPESAESQIARKLLK